MEDYKKKYEEALENFKKIKAANKDNKELVNFIEYEYPELKESEDEKIRKKVIDVLKLNIRGAESQMQASRGVDRTFEVYACNKVITWLEKQGKQSPVWSEEDEKIFNLIIQDYEAASKSFCGHKGKLDWLKSLKERYTWKPSKEQIRAIEDAINFLGCTKKVREDLKSLYEQLKKLREE